MTLSLSFFLSFSSFPDYKFTADRAPVLAASEVPDRWEQLTAVQIMEPTYFIPETMTTWTALQEMRKRRYCIAKQNKTKRSIVENIFKLLVLTIVSKITVSVRLSVDLFPFPYRKF